MTASPADNLELSLPPILDLVFNLLLCHCPQILPQDLARRTLWDSLNQHHASSQPLVIGDFIRYPFRYVCDKFVPVLFVFKGVQTFFGDDVGAR